MWGNANGRAVQPGIKTAVWTNRGSGSESAMSKHKLAQSVMNQRGDHNAMLHHLFWNIKCTAPAAHDLKSNKDRLCLVKCKISCENQISAKGRQIIILFFTITEKNMKGCLKIKVSLCVSAVQQHLLSLSCKISNHKLVLLL